MEFTQSVNVWDEIKSKLDIVDVISEYIPVQASGANFRALSPFKKEKTPSLMISQQKQIWHDFSSGRGGDIFGFVMQMENMTRAEVLRKLAEKAGVKLVRQFKEEQMSDEEKTLKEAGYEVLAWTAELYHKVLKKIVTERSNPVTQYCISRGLTDELIDLFQIGYVPKNNYLKTLLEKENQSTALFEKVQLLIEKNGQLKDKFSDRLMIPIRDVQGKVVGFTGRVLPYDTTDRPKYLNSSQSPWFDKGRLWFGLDLAKRSILLEKKAIVVEGNMDVIAAFGVDLTNTIASQGTSFTTEQLQMLKRTTTKLVLAFDNDVAGQTASEKFFLAGTPLGFQIFTFAIPQNYKDLDEYLKKEDPKSLEEEFYIERWLEVHRTRLTSTDTVEQKQAIHDCARLLTVVDDITREQYARKLHILTGISVLTVNKLIANLLASNTTKTGQTQVLADIEFKGTMSTSLKEDLCITWQKAYALASVHKKVDLQYVLEQLFPFLARLDLTEEKEIEAYKLNRGAEFELIAESENIEKLPQFLKSLGHLLDTHLVLFELQESELQAYYAFKLSLQKL